MLFRSQVTSTRSSQAFGRISDGTLLRCGTVNRDGLGKWINVGTGESLANKRLESSLRETYVNIAVFQFFVATKQQNYFHQEVQVEKDYPATIETDKHGSAKKLTASRAPRSKDQLSRMEKSLVLIGTDHRVQHTVTKSLGGAWTKGGLRTFTNWITCCIEKLVDNSEVILSPDKSGNRVYRDFAGCQI